MSQYYTEKQTCSTLEAVCSVMVGTCIGRFHFSDCDLQHLCVKLTYSRQKEIDGSLLHSYDGLAFLWELLDGTFQESFFRKIGRQLVRSGQDQASHVLCQLAALSAGSTSVHAKHQFGVHVMKSSRCHVLAR